MTSSDERFNEMVARQTELTQEMVARQNGLAQSGFVQTQRMYNEMLSQQALDQQRTLDLLAEQRRYLPVQAPFAPPQRALPAWWDELVQSDRQRQQPTPLYPRQFEPLQEGRSPWQLSPLRFSPTVSGDPLMTEIERLGENRRRQDRPTPDPVERRQEKARKALGVALNEAVESGYMTEDRAIAMIVAGGLNDRPMQPDGALKQVTTALAQAILSGAIDRATGDSIAAMLRLLASDTRPSQGETRPVTQPPERTEPSDALERRDDLIYEALILRPCHNTEHETAHRARVWVCDQQAASAWRTLLEGLAIETSWLPRQLHLTDTGERAPCCRRDGNSGTWLAWGRTTDPGLR